MPPMSEAPTNHGEGSGDENWGDASIELSPASETECHCHCRSGCNCGCAACMARVETASDQGNQAIYPGEGGPSGVVPSEPVNIPSHTSCHEHRDALDEMLGIQNNSFEAAASPPLTRENLQILARSASHSSSHDGPQANNWLGTSDNNGEALSENDMPMSDFTDAMSLDDESVFVEVGPRSLSVSMISEYSHAFTRSSPGASVYLGGLVRTSYIHTPLPLVAECTHAPGNRRCGCYCRMR